MLMPPLSSRKPATMIDRRHSIQCMMSMEFELALVVSVKSYMRFQLIIGLILESNFDA
jgi:hypothetical protein